MTTHATKIYYFVIPYPSEFQEELIWSTVRQRECIVKYVVIRNSTMFLCGYLCFHQLLYIDDVYQYFSCLRPYISMFSCSRVSLNSMLASFVAMGDCKKWGVPPVGEYRDILMPIPSPKAVLNVGSQSNGTFVRGTHYVIQDSKIVSVSEFDNSDPNVVYTVETPHVLFPLLLSDGDDCDVDDLELEKEINELLS